MHVGFARPGRAWRCSALCVLAAALLASAVFASTASAARVPWTERGVWMWYLAHPNVADSTALAKRLRKYHFSWVAVWAHDGSIPRNEDVFAAGWLKPLRRAGITLCAWGGLNDDPEGNAAVAAQVVTRWKFDCYIANAEGAYKADSGGDPARSARFVSALHLNVPLALATYGAACKPWNLAAVFDYAPWMNAGYHLLPEAYWNMTDCYEPLWVIQHSLEAGWPIDRVHPTIGIFSAERQLTGADYAPLLARDGATGFSSYLAEGMTDADYAALSSVR